MGCWATSSVRLACRHGGGGLVTAGRGSAGGWAADRALCNTNSPSPASPARVTLSVCPSMLLIHDPPSPPPASPRGRVCPIAGCIGRLGPGAGLDRDGCDSGRGAARPRRPGGPDAGPVGSLTCSSRPGATRGALTPSRPSAQPCSPPPAAPPPNRRTGRATGDDHAGLVAPSPRQPRRGPLRRNRRHLPARPDRQPPRGRARRRRPSDQRVDPPVWAGALPPGRSPSRSPVPRSSSRPPAPLARIRLTPPLLRRAPTQLGVTVDEHEHPRSHPQRTCRPHPHRTWRPTGLRRRSG